MVIYWVYVLKGMMFMFGLSVMNLMFVEFVFIYLVVDVDFFFEFFIMFFLLFVFNVFVI